MNRDQIADRSLMGKGLLLMWPYLSPFVTHSTDLAHVEVFHDNFWLSLQIQLVTTRAGIIIFLQDE